MVTRSQIMTNGAYCPKRGVAGEKCDFKKEEGKRQCGSVRVMEEERKCCSSKEPGTERVKIM